MKFFATILFWYVDIRSNSLDISSAVLFVIMVALLVDSLWSISNVGSFFACSIAAEITIGNVDVSVFKRRFAVISSNVRICVTVAPRFMSGLS